MNQIATRVKALFTIAVIALSSFLWLKGFLHSPLWTPQPEHTASGQKEFINQDKTAYNQEQILAEAYWLRYKDVMADAQWGRNGPQNVWGPRAHYQIHGRNEGRIFAPLPRPKDLQLEEKLARAYWQRYPDIAQSTVWGKRSQLGILGPRDHYKYVGRKQGKEWGISPHQ